MLYLTWIFGICTVASLLYAIKANIDSKVLRDTIGNLRTEERRRQWKLLRKVRDIGEDIDGAESAAVEFLGGPEHFAVFGIIGLRLAAIRAVQKSIREEIAHTLVQVHPGATRDTIERWGSEGRLDTGLCEDEVFFPLLEEQVEE